MHDKWGKIGCINVTPEFNESVLNWVGTDSCASTLPFLQPYNNYMYTTIEYNMVNSLAQNDEFIHMNSVPFASQTEK